MHQLTRNEGNLVTVPVSGKLAQSENDQLIPAWQRAIDQECSLRMLSIVENFDGWKPARIGSVFLPEKIRFYDLASGNQAAGWMRAG